ncbi:MAG: serine hydrolase domain-containing protein [Pseudomonadota bacterium]|nr:serine hydrolase domain-containing protein [Pseudomonadota bacterium]
MQELLSDIDEIRGRYDIPAVAFTLVSPDGPTQTRVLGLANRDGSIPATPDTLFRIGSITKTFTALAILQAQDRGLLRLDHQITEMAPDAPLDNPWRGTRPVHLVHLLEHTAGLLDLSRAEFDHNTPLSISEGLRVAPAQRVVRWPPGMHSSYSNAGYGLAGYVLEKATGISWPRIMQDWLFLPLGMNSASATAVTPDRGTLAAGYDTDGQTPIPYWHMVMPSFGAINASPREMGALPRLFLNDGRVDGRTVVSKAAIRRMERPTTTLAARSGLRYGYGPGLSAFPYRGFLFYGHGGDGDGYLSRFGYSRQLDRGYFVVINAFHHRALREIRERVQDYLIVGVQPPAAPPEPDVDVDSLKNLAGRYESVTWRFPWQSGGNLPEIMAVLVEGDGLYLHYDGEKRKLVPVSHRHFRHVGESTATMAFVRWGGALYFQGEEGNFRRIEPPRSRKTCSPPRQPDSRGLGMRRSRLAGGRRMESTRQIRFRSPRSSGCGNR